MLTDWQDGDVAECICASGSDGDLVLNQHYYVAVAGHGVLYFHEDCRKGWRFNRFRKVEKICNPADLPVGWLHRDIMKAKEQIK